MALNKQQKEQVVEGLRNNLMHSQASFLVGYKGLTVSQMESLRSELRKQGGKLQIAKARLMKRAAEGLEGAQDIVNQFKDQVGIVFTSEEPPAIAKILNQFAKGNEALELKAGFLDAQVLDRQGILRIAALPPKEVLLAQICGTIQAPASGLTRVVHTSVVRVLWLLQEVQKKKQS